MLEGDRRANASRRSATYCRPGAGSSRLGSRGSRRASTAAALGVGALDSGDASAVVPTGQEPLHRLRDPLKAELPSPLGELILVAGDELREVGTEEPLEGTHSPLPVGPGGRRIQGQRKLVCHMRIHSPEERAALLNLVEKGRASPLRRGHGDRLAVPLHAAQELRGFVRLTGVAAEG